MGLGSLCFSLPHFITDDYLSQVSIDVNSLSNANQSVDLCDKTIESDSNLDNAMKSLSNYKYFFILGQILHGIGAAPLITLGTTFLDESVSRVSAPLYIGIMQVSRQTSKLSRALLF